MLLAWCAQNINWIDQHYRYDMTDSTTKNAGRPKPIHTARSFSRMEAPTKAPSPRKRASTLQEAGIPAVPAARHLSGSQETDGKRKDVFEYHEEEEEEHAQSGSNTPGPELNLPSTFDELPIEIKSLTERFLESLSAKVHPTPLSADALSGLFQDFYDRAASHIATHIATLSSRIGRENSPAPSASSKGSGKGRPRAGSGAKRKESSPSNSGGEMLTASEVTDRKKARRLLELKRIALEEAVERAVCEKVYDGIWKHRSTDDDARDEKLRSRTAALSVVGIGLKELHVDMPPSDGPKQEAAEKEAEISESLAPAREALAKMDEEHYPLGKLQHLTAAHKSIVETLSQLFPSSSSADEILPTLIYTLITSPPDSISVVSNLNFIQRFRNSTKVDGEAAYCLVNLEAAISFLETVDLPSLRADELPEGPPKSGSNPSSPIGEKAPALPLPTLPAAAKPSEADISTVFVTASEQSNSSPLAADTMKALPNKPGTAIDGQTRPQMHQRRISAMVQAQADRIEAGRENILNTADQIYESINGTLENSLQFVFGRFKNQTSDNSPLPKTLEDARKLVSSREDDDEIDGVGSGKSSPMTGMGGSFTNDPLNLGSRNDSSKMLELLGGRNKLRDRSVDSSRSAGSGKRVAFASADVQKASNTNADQPPTPGSGNLFANINPLNRFGVNVPGFARFGRSPSLPTSSTHTPHLPSPSPAGEKIARLGDLVESPASTHQSPADALASLEKTRSRDSRVEDEDQDDNLNAREALAQLRKIQPPKKRYLKVESAAELKLGEVEDLLREYRRLSKAIGEAIAN